ncbi:MAG: hypothetical protein JSW07_03405 [bacterium]|nr:MAG: hypothetical protein JSW07_03405 [bacterium]
MPGLQRSQSPANDSSWTVEVNATHIDWLRFHGVPWIGRNRQYIYRIIVAIIGINFYGLVGNKE